MPNPLKIDAKIGTKKDSENHDKIDQKLNQNHPQIHPKFDDFAKPTFLQKQCFSFRKTYFFMIQKFQNLIKHRSKNVARKTSQK